MQTCPEKTVIAFRMIKTEQEQERYVRQLFCIPGPGSPRRVTQLGREIRQGTS